MSGAAGLVTWLGLGLLAGCLPLRAQTTTATEPQGPVASVGVLTVRSTLVLTPALVKTKGGALVYTLTAKDFLVTDDGVPQTVRLEDDTDSQPLALVVCVEAGGAGAAHLPEYRDLEPLLEAFVGGVEHQVAVVSFDSQVQVDQPWTPDVAQAAEKLANEDAGDPGAAILDALAQSVDLLRKAPPRYRRAILLLSETVDNGSKTAFEDALRAVSDTNTAIYALGFSSTRAGLGHEAHKFGYAGSPPLPPGPAGGCMSREPGADPDANGSRARQALDCASELLPPLRLIRMAVLAGTNALRKSVPETTANLTGGEYRSFSNAKGLQRDLAQLSNDVPNRYVLTFRPTSPHPGLHTLAVKVKDRSELDVTSRSAYWVEETP